MEKTDFGEPRRRQEGMMGEERLTDEQLQQALGDGDIPAHFVDLLAAEVRDRRRAERDMLSGDASYREHRRYETASRMRVALLIHGPWMDKVGASRRAVQCADALLVALESGKDVVK